MRPEDEDQALRLVALQNAQTILRARQRAEQELIRTKEALKKRDASWLLNQTGAKLASKLDIHSVVQTVTGAAIQLSGAQFGAFFYATTDADALSLYTPSADSRSALERFGHPRTTPDPGAYASRGRGDPARRRTRGCAFCVAGYR